MPPRTRVRAGPTSVERVLNVAAEVVADVFETTGNAARVRCDAVGWRRVGDVVGAPCDVAGAVVKGAFGVVGGVVGGALRAAGGGVARDGALLAAGGRDVAASVVGAVLSVGAAALTGAQLLLLLEQPSRALTPAELDVLLPLFGASVSLYNVRVVDGRAGVYDVNKRPFCRNNRIYLKGRDLRTLVHEIVHVWQYQHHGTRYIGDALGAQAFVEDAYNWERERARGKTAWVAFNAEAQAAYIDHLYAVGVDTDDALTALRGARNHRLSHRLRYRTST